MTKEEVLKLALEALEDLGMKHFESTGEVLYKETFTAIKEALMSHSDGAQPEQEPVAWMDDYNACKCPDNEARCFSDKVFRMMQKHTDSLVKLQEPVAKVCHDLDGHIGWNPNLKQLPNEGTPLYTTPPQRKPLTDEEAQKIFHSEHCNISKELAGILARAIEAAHGIKEKNT